MANDDRYVLTDQNPQNKNTASENAPSNVQSAPNYIKKQPLKLILILLIVCCIVLTLRLKTSDNLDNTSSNRIGSNTLILPYTTLMEMCPKGALYENNYIIYGSARIYAPGYSLENAVNSVGRYLVSENGQNVISVESRDEKSEPLESKNITKTDLSKSFYTDKGIAPIKVTKFEKYEVSGYDVVQCILLYQKNDISHYYGEIIVLPTNPATKTLRLNVDSTSDDGSDIIHSIFKTLEISSSFQNSYLESDDAGHNRITVR